MRYAPDTVAYQRYSPVQTRRARAVDFTQGLEETGPEGSFEATGVDARERNGPVKGPDRP